MQPSIEDMKQVTLEKGAILAVNGLGYTIIQDPTPLLTAIAMLYLAVVKKLILDDDEFLNRIVPVTVRTDFAYIQIKPSSSEQNQATKEFV